jgi:hypothetical protein
MMNELLENDAAHPDLTQVATSCQNNVEVDELLISPFLASWQLLFAYAYKLIFCAAFSERFGICSIMAGFW